jgi:hypothetical protein
MTGRPALAARLAQHRAFWKREEPACPPASFRVGDFFFARHFRAARPLLVYGRRITPELLRVADFLPDYERQFAQAEELGQDGFWTAEPYTGIPWMEAMLGCEVYAQEESFISKPPAAAGSDPGGRLGWAAAHARFDPANAWFRKYMEFVDVLAEHSAGRFTVGQPIMRGPTDMLGALLGQTELIFALADDPAGVGRLAARVADVFLAVIREMQKRVPAFHGGAAMGFYHVWTPGPCIWFQDDLSAVLSPGLYREHFIPLAERICAAYDWTGVHLHPSSFFIIDDLMKLEGLRAIEINKDVGGPSVAEMLPVLKRVLERKNLILWGDLSLDDLALARRELPCQGLFFNIVAPDLEQARARLDFVRKWE